MVTGHTAETDPRVTRSRARMLTAATELLVEAGPRAVTVDAVVERSGVAKSTLYRHWASVTELLIDVMRENVPAPKAVALTDGFEPALRAVVGGIADALASPRWACIVPALLSLRRHMPEMAELFDADWDAKIATIDGVLTLGVAEGRLPATVDTRQAAYLLVGPLLFASIKGDDDQVVALADEVVDRFLASYGREVPPPNPPPGGHAMTVPDSPTHTTRLDHIVVGVDDSPESLHALDLAAAIGAPRQATLTIVHVRPHPSALGFSAVATVQHAEAEHEVDALVGAAAAARLGSYPGQWHVAVRDGNVAHELLAIADDVDADLVVVGHRSHGPVRDAILGSVAASTVHHSKRSVLIAVPPR